MNNLHSFFTFTLHTVQFFNSTVAPNITHVILKPTIKDHFCLWSGNMNVLWTLTID